MAEYYPLPDQVDDPPPQRTTPGQILWWLRQILQYLVIIVLPFAHWDAKMGVLIGDDAKRRFLEGFVPRWLEDLLNKLTGITHEPQEMGVLGKNERNLTAEGFAPAWVSLYEVVRDMMFSLFQTAVEDVDAVQPLYGVGVDSDTGILRNFWTQKAFRVPPEAKTAKPKLLNVLAQVAALLSIADRVPIPVVHDQYIAKNPVEVGVEVITFAGSIADVEAAKEMEIVTRLDQWRSSVPAKPGG